MTDVSEVSLSDLITEGCQTRSKTRPEAVAEYAAVLGGGGSLDPCTAYRDQDGKFWLAAGHHRKAAYERAGRQKMPCIVREGGQWEAIEFGIKDNAKHTGERLTAADRRHNVELVLSQNRGMSARTIAELCGVSPTTVGDQRARSGVQTGHVRGKDGKVYDTSKGKTQRSTKPRGSTSSHGREVPNTEPPMKSHQHEWESDGNGGRFCSCGENHPETPSIVDGQEGAATAASSAEQPTPPADNFLPADLQPVQIAKKPVLAKVKPVAELFELAFHHLGLTKKTLGEVANVKPGADYQLTIDILNKADRRIMQWRDEA